MRSLLLFRGAPGSGKSTFIDEHGLRPYALSADELRLKCQSAEMQVDGTFAISQNNDRVVWDILFKLLEIRMKHGEFVVIDATNSKTSEINNYKNLCETYKYRMYIIDFTDLPIEECKKRNANREPFKRVPEEVIDKMYSRFEYQSIPAGVKSIKKDELDSIYTKQFDLSSYEKIVHIGDIHGCYSALKEYFDKNPFNDNYMYIFLGDYIDRGIENVEILQFLLTLMSKKNVLMLEGNHEKNLFLYANGANCEAIDFIKTTKVDLEKANLYANEDFKKSLRTLYKKFGQLAWYKYGDKEIFVSHGGISTLPENLTFISSNQLIHGVGKYADFEVIADAWMNTTKENQYQIYGHRNMTKAEVQIKDRVFNLEGKVEYGGELRIVELDKNGFNIIEIKNNVFRELDDALETASTPTEKKFQTVEEVVNVLRSNNLIIEKKFKNISSFNFSQDVFFDKIWNVQTVFARGLYINTRLNKIVARGYNKFFNINERPETRLVMLQNILKFPVTCYVKENGFLGLISYDEESDELFITTKSNPTGEFAKWLKDIFEANTTEDTRAKIKEMCKNENVTFVFECVDMKHDPHIIEYDGNRLFLLDIIKNDLVYSKYDYDMLTRIGNALNLKVKTKAYEINSWSEFYNWYILVNDEDYEFENRKIEGFVIEDSNGYMVKVKLAYYSFWKFMRTVAQSTMRYGRFNRTGSLTSAESNKFYAFCQKLYNETDKETRENMPKDIIYFRKRFLADK